MSLQAIAELAKALAKADPTAGHQNVAETLAAMAAAENFNSSTVAAQADAWMPW